MYDRLSDAQIISQVISGNRDLFRVLVDRYLDKLMRYVNYLIHDEQKSSDIVQETLIKAYKNLQGYNSSFKFSSWLFRIAHNESINLVKKNWREMPILPEMDIASSENLEEDFSRREVINMAHQCLFQLPREYSEPLSLYYLEDLSYQDISDILRIPVSTVGTRISRAKILMKKICQKTT